MKSPLKAPQIYSRYIDRSLVNGYPNYFVHFDSKFRKSVENHGCVIEVVIAAVIGL